MESNICTESNTEKCHISFLKKHSESKVCNRKRGLKRYHDNKDKISNLRKIYYEENI